MLNTDWAAINYAFLEYKLQRIAAMMPAQTAEQIHYLSRATAALAAPVATAPGWWRYPKPPHLHCSRMLSTVRTRGWAAPCARCTGLPEQPPVGAKKLRVAR